LKEYLESRESEVITIMMSLFDEEEIMKSYIRSERYDAICDTARNLIKNNKLSLEEIVNVTGLTLDKVKKLEEEIMQSV
jgi:hypothetical protein